VAGSAPRAAPENESEVDLAIGILTTRSGCSRDAALELLSKAALANRMDVSDLAVCLVADQEFR
jgi:AmiR/NasT family two-component response regulator